MMMVALGKLEWKETRLINPEDTYSRTSIPRNEASASEMIIGNPGEGYALVAPWRDRTAFGPEFTTRLIRLCCYLA